MSLGIRVSTETLCQELIDAEAAAFIGAAQFERTESRTGATQRRPSEVVDHDRASWSCGSRNCTPGGSIRR